MARSKTKEKMLQEGRALLQLHGFHGFSFQHIADKLRIKKASLYDHFPTKDDLIIGILRKYGDSFDTWAEGVVPLPPLERVRKVFDVFYFFTSDHHKVCPVLALAADFRELSKGIQGEMQRFVDRWLAWLQRQIEEGQADGSIRADLSAAQLAAFVYSLGMGSQFQARIREEPRLPLRSAGLVADFLSANLNRKERR